LNNINIVNNYNVSIINAFNIAYNFKNSK